VEQELNLPRRIRRSHQTQEDQNREHRDADCSNHSRPRPAHFNSINAAILSPSHHRGYGSRVTFAPVLPSGTFDSSASENTSRKKTGRLIGRRATGRRCWSLPTRTKFQFMLRLCALRRAVYLSGDSRQQARRCTVFKSCAKSCALRVDAAGWLRIFLVLDARRGRFFPSLPRNPQIPVRSRATRM
jgi:hypothetical protein